ncbi:hypothetical protein Tco_1576832 [Tanacetum coccineum]
MPVNAWRLSRVRSKVRNSQNKAVVSKVSSNSSTPGISLDVVALTTEVSELKNLMKTMLIDKQKAQAPATVKAVEQSCVTCGGAHSHKNCPATYGNVYQDNIQEYVSQAAAANFNQGNSNSRPPMVSNQIRPPGFPRIQNNQNRFNQNQGNNFNQNRGTNFNQNRGSNFNQGQVYQPPTIQTPVYQAPPQQMQGVSKTDFENYVKARMSNLVAVPLIIPCSFLLVLLREGLVKFLEEFADELTLLKKGVHEENFQVYSNPLYEFDDNFTSKDDIDEDRLLFLAHGKFLLILRKVISIQKETFQLPGHRKMFMLPVEDSESVQEEINIFLVPDDLIPPGVENDDSEDEDNELPNLDHQDNPLSPRPPPEPPDVCLNFKPDTAMKNDEDFYQGEIVLSLNVEDVNYFTFVIWTFLPFFTYPEDSPVILSLRSEDFVFDADVSTFHFSLKPVPFALPKDE